MKPKVKRQKVQPQLDQKEMKQLMQGGPEEEAEEAAQQNEADQVKGVGFRRSELMTLKSCIHDMYFVEPL